MPDACSAAHLFVKVLWPKDCKGIFRFWVKLPPATTCLTNQWLRYSVKYLASPKIQAKFFACSLSYRCWMSSRNAVSCFDTFWCGKSIAFDLPEVRNYLKF